ncbi:MAG: hypothetical protein GY943_23520 [Chloroflexi bacterium]|nr:hypothetical protein [Chloroflexota bacterium]
MKQDLLENQFETLEVPEDQFQVSIELEPEEIVAQILKGINISGPEPA